MWTSFGIHNLFRNQIVSPIRNTVAEKLLGSDGDVRGLNDASWSHKKTRHKERVFRTHTNVLPYTREI
jgi:hypothetical protein